MLQRRSLFALLAASLWLGACATPTAGPAHPPVVFVHGNGDSIGPATRFTSRPKFVGCSPSASFAGSIRSRIESVSMCAGNGNWTM